MKVSDLSHGRLTTVELRRVDGAQFPEGLVRKSEVSLFSGDDGAVRITMADTSWEVEGVAAKDGDAVGRILGAGLPRIAWLVQAVPDRGPAAKLLVQIHEFVSAIRWTEPIEIGVDERIVDDLRKRRARLLSVESVVAWLDEHIVLHPRALGELPRVILSGSPEVVGSGRTAFRLHGRGYAVDVERDAQDRLSVKRVTESRRPVEGDEHRPLHLVTGSVCFCDLTIAGSFRGAALNELDTLVAQADSYLSLWNQYNEIERRAIVERAQEFGWIRYVKAKPLGDGGWRFELESSDAAEGIWTRLDALEERQDLQADDELPAAIVGQDDQPKKKRARPFVGELVGRRQNPPVVDLRPPIDQEDRMPPSKGYLFVALGGDEKRIIRRTEAWTAIRGCSNPLPQLGMLIEGRPVPVRQRRRLEPLTRAARELLPKPNQAQRRALDVALNTPDIALIQGPPGTGKTRVIAALQARLAEHDEEAALDGLAGNTLLTSFQHDAVENAAMATRVMGLPAIKIGSRRGSDEPGDAVARWAETTAQVVRANRATTGREDSVHIALRRVREIAVAYLEAPSTSDEPREVLARIRELASPWLKADLLAEIEREHERLNARAPIRLTNEDRAFALTAGRSLRTDPVSFADDGPANAYKVLRRLRRLDDFDFGETDIDCLKRAADWDLQTTAPPELLSALGKLRDQLIDRLQPTVDEHAGPRAHADVERLIARTLDALSERARERVPGIDLAIDEWLATLERDPQSCRDTVQHYSMVLAATCQQSVSHLMSEAKLGADTVFRTVIVDEAARSNPLDLLIPMSRAERRIVLVGDHRQLPHILEPAVERELEQSIEEQTRAALRRSLFERLFIELRAREARDGISRTVSLNVQYRMHPVLAAFVSEQFYEPHGEGFGSELDEYEFAHTVQLADNVSLTGKVAAWIDVPLERGAETRERSRRRPVEAQHVAREVAAVVSRHPELSVGVITFYAAQRDEILVAMAKHELTEADDRGAHRVRERWQTTSDGRERLRIGSVDAFQGKEFDVVFLSMTRSNRVQVKDEQSRRSRYGFLLLENRLCVAMSRQKRLLVVVGDPAMVSGPEGAESLPSLHAFRKLCEGPHGFVLRR